MALIAGWRRGALKFLYGADSPFLTGEGHPLRLAALLEATHGFQVVEKSGWLVVLCGCCERPACLRCSAKAGGPVTHPWERFHRGESVCSLGRAPEGWERLVGVC